MTRRGRASVLGWLHEGPHAIETERNGTLTLTRRLGSWTLHAEDGSEQASPGMDGLWRASLGRVGPAGTQRAHALVLGVALGGTFRLIRKRWPAARVTGVDWEPALFELGRVLGIHGGVDDATRVVAGDAAVVVPTLDDRFDLVLVDLFRGREVTEAARDDALIDAVVARLEPGAVVLVNAFESPHALAGWRARLGPASIEQYVGNLVALFQT